MTQRVGSSGYAVYVSNLVKEYSKHMPRAVDELSFSVPEGEVFGLLGPNGAGKTTTIGVLTTRVKPTSGTAKVCGVDVAANPAGACRVLGVVPQQNNLDRSLNIRQNLLYHAAYHGIGRRERERRADEILDLMGLTDHAQAKADFVSGGQAQRIMIGRALMHRPRVLFLDEPATGLDPQSRLFVHERVQRLRAFGVTIVVTTHDMEEAEKLCDRVGIVDHGKMLALDTPANLTKALPGSTTVTVSVTLAGADPERLRTALADVPNTQRVERITKTAGGNGMTGDGPFGFGPPGGGPSGPPPASAPTTKPADTSSNGVGPSAATPPPGPPPPPARPYIPKGNHDPFMPESLANAVTQQIPKIATGSWPDLPAFRWEESSPRITYPTSVPSSPGETDGESGDTEADYRLYTVADPATVLPDVLRVTSGFGCSVTDISLGTPSLEDVFVHLTGRDLR